MHKKVTGAAWGQHRSSLGGDMEQVLLFKITTPNLLIEIVSSTWYTPHNINRNPSKNYHDKFCNIF